MLESVYPPPFPPPSKSAEKLMAFSISLIGTKFQEAKGFYSWQGMIIINKNDHDVNTLIEQFWVEGDEVTQGAYDYWSSAYSAVVWVTRSYQGW